MKALNTPSCRWRITCAWCASSSSLGIEKVRLTGGEPLLRKGLVDFVRQLAKLRTRSGEALDLALTTNGHLLEDLAAPLKDAGLTRITVSMDAVDAATFARITRVPGSFERVVKGIRAAQRAGLDPVKVNCVLLRGFNDDQIVPFAKFAREEGVIVRFIEFMPLEEDRLVDSGYRRPYPRSGGAAGELPPCGEVDAEHSERNRRALHLRRRHWGDRHHRAGLAGFLRTMQPPAAHFRRKDSHLPVLAIRPRPLRCDEAWGRSDEELISFIERTVALKEARHHIGEPDFLKPSRSMVHIGG